MVKGNDITSEIGEWADAEGEFSETVSRHGGIGFDADLSDENRFVVGVVQLLRRRRAQMEDSEESASMDLAVFILQPQPPGHVTVQRVPMLDNGLTGVTGRLWFTSAPVISAHYTELPPGTDDERFAYVVDELGLGERPTLIYDPRLQSPELRLYPAGLGQPDTREMKPLEGDVAPGDVFDAIDELYRQCLVTPSAMIANASLWRDAGHYRPQENAEALVQSHLKAGLVSRFPFCTVRHEQLQPAGRTDLEIEQLDPIDHSNVTRHGTIELKVLRSFWSSGTSVSDGETQQSVEGGMEQAHAYCREKQYRWSALCCFDMRRSDIGDTQCFAGIRQRANELGVHLRRWFLYASPGAYQRALAAIPQHQ